VVSSASIYPCHHMCLCLTYLRTSTVFSTLSCCKEGELDAHCTTSYEGNLNTAGPTFLLGLPVCLLYSSVVCKPVQIFPCMRWYHRGGLTVLVILSAQPEPSYNGRWLKAEINVHHGENGPLTPPLRIERLFSVVSKAVQPQRKVSHPLARCVAPQL
jgi:hypothetical protein